MANTQINTIQQNIQTTANMLEVTQGLQKTATEMKGVRAKVAGFKKSLESSGLKPLDLSGFVSGGGLLKPFQDGLKKAIKAEDELANKSKKLKAPALAKDAVIPKPLPRPATAQLPAPVKGETSTNLAKFNVSLDNISLKIGQALLPAVKGLVTALVPVMTTVGKFVAEHPQVVEGLAAAAVAFTVVTTAAAGLSAVLTLLASPIGLFAAGVALAAGLIVANWKPLSAFFARLWQQITPVVLPMANFFRTLFDFTPLGMVINNWGPVSTFFAALWNVLKAVAAPVIDFYTTLFAYSPQALILKNWQPLVGLFASIWDLLRAVSVPISAFIQDVVDSISLSVVELYAVISEQLGWSPLETIIEAWGSVTVWIQKWSDKFYDALAPVREFFNGGLGTLAAEASAKVDVLTRAQLKTNAEGKGEWAPGFFGSDADSTPGVSVPEGALTQNSSSLTQNSSSLTQTSNSLIQQSAANNRTQLEGGLTVRFENAPAGLRTDQPQTNQPGLALSSRIGYRSLSAGGSNELA
ncbi:phage tail protein [Pseudomonas sp. IzPS59]|uniref:phage tail protein n=1 Tax=Pseudomonas sp. IzPS59 TaxID=2774459 RepID=UPI001787B713|nr:phage tail protein [Pseudomonas sp. IzPS59]